MISSIRHLICITIGVILYCCSLGNLATEITNNQKKDETEISTETTVQKTTIPETTEEILETTEETTLGEATTQKPLGYVDYDVPKNNTIKSYMSYRAITSTNSQQYKLQTSLAYTDNNGLRMVGDRYCVALGSYYTITIGQHVDIELENGKIIRGILSDCKADIHTDSTNRINPNGSVVEFIVNVDVLDDVAKRRGDISCINGWDSKVVNVRVYDIIEEF